MADDADNLPTDRRSPVGEPVIRGDAAITGQRADEAVRFDPDDPESVAVAAETVRSFAEETGADVDNLYMLRGAAACAALVRAEGSYKAARERAGGEVTISFIRKWARVHDLPRAIRVHVARGDIAPTAAKHIARVPGETRHQLAWATLDGDLTVREVRAIASEINDDTPIEEALDRHDVTPGRLSVSLPPAVYRELHRRAALDGGDIDAVVSDALEEYLR